MLDFNVSTTWLGTGKGGKDSFNQEMTENKDTNQKFRFEPGVQTEIIE